MPNQRRRISRRALLQGGGVVAAASVVGWPVANAGETPVWDESFDVIVVGAGAAGASAAIHAHDAKASVALLEKLPGYGGTAAKSVGGIWVPNNRFLRSAHIKDARADALRYMVRLSYPEDYQPQHPTYGAPRAGFDLIGAFFDHAAPVFEGLEQRQILRLTNQFAPGVLMPDYFAHLPENRVPRGRALVTLTEEGGVGNGAELMRQFGVALQARDIAVRTRHRVSRLIQSPDGAVLGVEVQREAGETVRMRALGGVVFASGGFTHDADLRRSFLKGPIYGGCAAPGSEGDFVRLGGAVGAQLGNMANAWWCQIPIELAVHNTSVATGIWTSPGDSMIQVNRHGLRFANEKFVYNERTQAQFAWDPVRGEYSNLLAYMVYDERTAREFAGYAPLPMGGDAPIVISAPTLAALAQSIAKRIATIAAHTGGATLDAQFAANLVRTVERFNGFARRGVDEDFHRGETPIEPFFHYFGPSQPTNTMPNVTMHPLAEQGPYHCIVLAAGALDTKGGPRINPKAEVQNVWGASIAGLYGAGNCVASPTGPAYWAGGATLGPAITFGALAGQGAAARAHTLVGAA